MVKTKNIFKTLILSRIFSFAKRLKKQNPVQEMWSGNYTSWADAQIMCTGYDSEIILEKCKCALLKVKRGEALYERDGVSFDKVQYSLGLLVGLQKAALENDGKLFVLDFGGSLGTTYYQNKVFLNSLKELQWYIVEQPQFVKCGKEFFEDNQLKFYCSIEECMGKYKPQVLLVSSVLQYLEKPYEWITKFIDLEIPYIIIDRSSFIEKETNILTVQKIPESIYSASYPAWFFNYQFFINCFTSKYDLILDFKDSFTDKIVVEGKVCYWRGMIFKIKEWHP